MVVRPLIKFPKKNGGGDRVLEGRLVLKGGQLNRGHHPPRDVGMQTPPPPEPQINKDREGEKKPGELTPICMGLTGDWLLRHEWRAPSFGHVGNFQFVLGFESKQD